MTDPFEDEFSAEGRRSDRPHSARKGVFGLGLGVILGAVVAAALVGALLLIRFILLPPGSLN